jgi:hypothetical protein
MNATPELTAKQNEALDTLVDLFRRSRKNDPDAQTAFLGVDRVAHPAAYTQQIETLDTLSPLEVCLRVR